MAKKKKESKHKYSEDIEKQVASIVVDSEYSTARINRSDKASDYESFVDLFDSERTEKDYDWQSDISLPEFPTHMLTQAAIDASQYFQTRDFVEAYLEDSSDEALAAADSAKECINRTLNQRHIHHYQKYIRAKTINHLQGNVYIECWWEQQTKQDIVGTEIRVEELDVDVYGNPLVDMEIQMPATREYEESIIGDVPIVDRFNYDVHDPRNVFTDNNYVYSLQDKQWIIIRSEKTLEELEEDKDRHGYFNLELLKDVDVDGNTETRSETGKDNEIIPEKTPQKPFDILRRYGKFWCKVKERDENDMPIEVEPGIDSAGKPLNDAELLETCITYAMNGSHKVLISFHLQPYKDAYGNPYRPLLRGICYIHPTDDEGVGDGKYSRELQIAIDDTFNVSNDRVLLATIPTFKTKKYALDDNDSIYVAPNHNIELEDPNDIQELKIQDNISGAMNQLAMLTGKMQQVTSIHPPAMGSVVGKTTTATAVAEAGQSTDIRTNYKSMTFEQTALTELYWMILQMTYQFAFPETAMKLMGDKAYNFDPTKDYFYKPVSASIESEQSKRMKIQTITNILTSVSTLQHPDTPKLVNYLLSRMFTYMGDEYANFGDKLPNPNIPLMPEGMGQAPAGGGTPSNQYGFEQSPTEMMTRGMV